VHDKLSLKTLLKQLIYFHVGLVVIWAPFFLYLIDVSAIKDWYAQSFAVADAYMQRLGEAKKFQNFPFPAEAELIYSLFRGIFTSRTYHGGPNVRSIIYSFVFFNAFILWLSTCVFPNKNKLNLETNKLLFLFSSVTIFGYLNALHLYEIFRLQTSSSLGLGLLLFSLRGFFNRFGRYNSYYFLVFISALFLYLVQSFVFASSWDVVRAVNGGLNEPSGVKIFRGKWYDNNKNYLYTNLASKLDEYHDCGIQYLVNKTQDSLVPYLVDGLVKVQRSPFSLPEKLSQAVASDEDEKISRLLSNGLAVLVVQGGSQFKIPLNYKVDLSISEPQKSVNGSFVFDAAYGSDVDQHQYFIAVPKNINCPKIR
jgi:hypothetical protein